MKQLVDQPRRGGRVFLTGGTGYLGALMAAKMLRSGWADELIIPTRRPDPSCMPAELATELRAAGLHLPAAQARIRLMPWSGAEQAQVGSLQELLRSFSVDSVVHCAGCLDYFNAASLQAVNVDFTARLCEAAEVAGVSRMVFISTAYAAGYAGRPVPESLLGEPERDPTDYTATKRRAEHIVAASAVPSLILRPSIVIGNATDGRYSGKRYGLYQQWMGVERLLTDRYHDTLHTVATEQPLNLLHQDSFQAAAGAALAWLPDGAVMNLVTDTAQAPNMKDLWRLLCEVTRPQRVVFYRSLEEVDLRAIHLRQRAYLSFAQTNLEIGAYGWAFERGWLQALSAQRGLVFHETTPASIRTCQDRFMEASEAFRQYRSKFAAQLVAELEELDGPACFDQHAAA